MRLDRGIASQLQGHSRSAIAKWIREGLVRVDGVATNSKDCKRKVRGSESIAVRVPAPRPLRATPQPIPLVIVFEDDHIVVLNKPHGLTVHPGSGQPDGTLANGLVHHFREMGSVGDKERPGIVHRLDKDTSGVIVVARTERAHVTLSEAFAQRTVKKTYLACVHGGPDAREGSIDLPIGRSIRQRTRMTIRHDGGRPSRTGWRIHESMRHHTLLSCFPETGRTHQIRVHLRALGLPIVGDPFYGWRQRPGEDSNPRLLLHAKSLAFDHPATGKRVEYSAPLPEDYEAVLTRLRAMS